MILQADPKAGYLAHQEEIDSAVHGVLASGWYILGREVEAFEQEFASFVGVQFAISGANGTAALELALRACGAGPGDLVFTVSHTAVATVAAIELAGATPVLVDIDPRTYTMDPNSLEAALKHAPPGNPKAIIPVHLYGQPADMSAITALAQRYGLVTIEDCAQSHGATLEGRMTGTWGHMAAFSFYPTKNLGALGDGGMVVTNDAQLAERVRLLRQYGWRQRFVSEIPGTNSRLDELQAAILRVKLKYLEEENDRRRSLARQFDSLLLGSNLVLPVVPASTKHAFHQYVLRSDTRDALAAHLKQEGIGTQIHYPMPVHLQPAYHGRLPQVVPMVHTELAVGKILSLPMYPQLTDSQIRQISDSILRFCRQSV